LRQFITVVETWVYLCTSEIKQQSIQWNANDELVPKKNENCCIGWKDDSNSFLVFQRDNFNYLEKGKTANRRYYANLL